jgi:hypothetical protein
VSEGDSLHTHTVPVARLTAMSADLPISRWTSTPWEMRTTRTSTSVMAAEADDGHAAAFGAFDRLGRIKCCDSRGGLVGASIALLGVVLIVVEGRRSTHN